MLWSTTPTPAEQRSLRRLSIFAEAARSTREVVCGSDPSSPESEADGPSEVFDRLASLLDKSLVYIHEGPDGERRFTLLETVREFGLDQLRASCEIERVARAHAGYYLHLIEATGALLFAGAPQQQRSAAEQHNLHDALRWLLHHG
jgi:predicted ATPase